MRVLLTDHHLASGYTLGLASGLRANDVEVRIGAQAKSGDPSVTAIYPRSWVQMQRFRKTLDAAIGAFSFQRLLATMRPDVLHLQWPTPLDLVYALEAKRIWRMPIVYTVHNPVNRVGDVGRGPAIQERLIDLADVVLVHGPSMLELVVNNQPAAASKTHIVEIGNYEHMIRRYPRAEARAQLNLPAELPLFVFVGQLRPRKGIDLLLEAFVEYRQQGGTGHLLVAGSATIAGYEGKLREIVERWQSAVHWMGSSQPLSQREIDLALSAATQVALPFHDASHSASLILAMTHGRCVLSTDVGEIPRTLGDRGILITPGDRQSLVEALALGENDQQLCDEIGERARGYTLTNLSWTTIGARTRELYLLAKNARDRT